MSRLLPVAEQLLMLGALGGQVQPRRSDKLGMIIFGVAALLGVVALVFLIVAMSYWLQSRYSPDLAALLTAGVALSFAVLVAAVGYAVNEIRKNKINAVADELKERVSNALEAVSEEMEDPIRAYPKSSLALASLAGYVIGSKVL